MKQEINAEYIKNLRLQLGMTPDQFGEACGLTGAHRGRNVWRWERGEIKPSAPVMKRMEGLKFLAGPLLGISPSKF